jgi:galactokinase
VCATNHGLYARVKPVSEAELHYTHFKGELESTRTWRLDVHELETLAREGSFFSYVAGTAAVVVQHPKYLARKIDRNAQTHGLSICNYKTTLPMKKGLSSSAAVCVLVATAFDTVFELGFTQEELMEIAYQVRFV